MEEYKYQVLPEALLYGKYDCRKIRKVMYGMKDNYYLWSGESPESLLKKEESLSLLTERLESHLDHWIDHLDHLEPELVSVQSSIATEVIKIKCLTEHFADVNKKQRDFLDLSNSILNQQ